MKHVLACINVLGAIGIATVPLIDREALAAPPPTRVTSLMEKPFADIPGKEGLMILVEYPPGGADPIHRHDAHAFVYVLEGSIVMQVEGGREVTLEPGESYYEGPDDVHVVGRNASTTRPAKFLVVLVKKQGAPVLMPVPQRQ